MSKNCRIEFVEGELTCLCNHRDYRNCDLYEEDDETYDGWGSKGGRMTREQQLKAKLVKQAKAEAKQNLSGENLKKCYKALEAWARNTTM